ncbi:hypothetical protein ACFOD4_15915 [Pseudoroseomonas globiformis]|uniref:Tripartite tricarboxylate transporter substrate binding protein n=1 Tax=Teichococcus globiformis TaxID=2307229 RepID=A0ABV7G5T3_9PROT
MMETARRHWLRGAGAGLATALLGRAAQAQAPVAVRPEAQPESAVLLMPGPEGGAAMRWAEGVAAGLVRGMPHLMVMRPQVLGGPDGVTAANRFATLGAGNGRTLLVLPGQAAHLRLVGESRAQFSPEAWLPLCVSWQGAVLGGRGAWPPTSPLRLALPSPDAPEASALLALDLMGVPATPVFTRNQPPEDSLARGQADAMVLSGPAPLRLARQAGLTPWLELETPGRREHPQLPSTAATSGPAAALEAMQAGFAALHLRAALMLPELTAADTVASWRRAALRWQEEESRQPAEAGVPALVGAEARAVMASLFPAPPAMLAYREWLLRRLSWQAG